MGLTLEKLKELGEIDIDSIKRMAGADDEDGHSCMKMIRATHDFAVDGGAIGDIKLGQFVPAGAIITRAFYQVNTTYTSTATGTDKATIAIALGASVLNTAVAIETGTPYDAGLHVVSALGSDDESAATYVALAAQTELKLTVAVAALTAGKMTIFVEYVVGV